MSTDVAALNAVRVPSYAIPMLTAAFTLVMIALALYITEPVVWLAPGSWLALTVQSFHVTRARRATAVVVKELIEEASR